MRIDSSGKVGIGTSSPNGTLTVRNDSTNTEQLILGNSTNTGGRDWRLGRDNVASGDFIIKYSDGTNSNVTTEAMRIDNSGNLLVGTTDTDPYTTSTTSGISLDANGRIGASYLDSAPMILNRRSSDGTIAQFRKDGSTVGSIGTSSSSIYTATGDTGLLFFDSGDAILPFTESLNTRDAAVDLGRSTTRFKDLYLSGGVVETTTTVSYASSIALSYNNGSIQTVTLTGNVTFTDSLADGEAVVLMLNNGASHTVTWTAVNKWVTSGGNVAPTLTANDTLVFWKIGSTVYGAYAGSYT